MNKVAGYIAAVKSKVPTKVVACRKPNAGEIRFGYGAYHYAEFDLDQWLRSDLTMKRWIVIDRVRWTFSHYKEVSKAS